MTVYKIRRGASLKYGYHRLAVDGKSVYTVAFSAWVFGMCLVAIPVDFKDGSYYWVSFEILAAIISAVVFYVMATAVHDDVEYLNEIHDEFAFELEARRQGHR